MIYIVRSKYWAWLIVAVFMLLIGRASHATNIGFESGNISNWTSSGGDVAVSTGVNNVSFGGGLTWTITPYGSYMAQLYPSGSVTFDNTVSSLGLNSVENTAIRTFMSNNSGGGDPTPTNASWIRRTVTLQAGVTYSFAWNYLSTDYVPFNDGSMMTLVHSTKSNVVPVLNNSQQRYALLGFTNPGTGNYSTDSYGSTGWQLAVFTVPENGDYVLGFATFNLGDTALSPMLFIDEQQGTTTLNGQPFAPIPPNSGSTAPVTGGGSSAPTCPNNSTCSSDPFTGNAGFSNRANIWSQQTGNKIIVEQIGNYNVTTVNQSGNKNYVELEVTGSSNSSTVSQTTASSASSNYIEMTIAGSNNTVNLTQNGTGNKGIMASVGDNTNNLTVIQTNGGNHYTEVNLSGGSKTVDITQSGTSGHMSRVELSGGATALTLTQQGPTQQSYSISHTCSQASCAAITVTQGQ